MKRIFFILFFLPLVCLGQMTSVSYYVAETITAWEPTDIAGCKLWLDAGQGITKDGSDYVSQWADMSGNLNHANQSTGAYQPLWVDAQLNGEPVVRFDGIDNYLVTLGTIPVPYTVFAVWKIEGSSTTGQCLFGGNYNPTYPLFMHYSTYLVFSDGTCWLTNPYTVPFSDAIQVTIYSESNLASYYINGGSYVSVATATPLNWAYHYEGQALGCHGQANVNMRFLDGYIAELIVYDSALSAPNRVLVETYLDNKYFP